MQKQVNESPGSGEITNKLFSLVIPVYKNESSLAALLAAMTEVKQQMSEDFEVVFVIDGSPDRCYELLAEALPQAEFASQLILLSRNFGSFQAIAAAIQRYC